MKEAAFIIIVSFTEGERRDCWWEKIIWFLLAVDCILCFILDVW